VSLAEAQRQYSKTTIESPYWGPLLAVEEVEIRQRSVVDCIDLNSKSSLQNYVPW
jgi:hypothetical protein